MSRTPTFVRLNLDDLVTRDPAGTAAGLAARGEHLLIEDDRRGMVVPPAWLAVAAKVRMGGKTIKDSFGSIDPTERRGI